LLCWAHAWLHKHVGKGLRAVLHALHAAVHGRTRHLVALQSADNTLFVMRELRAFPVLSEERTTYILRENRGLLATKEN
jgi:hypothetical protein